MITISLDETHHLVDGEALYLNRYKRVMSFHNGIAPVEDERGAYFIDIRGDKLFHKTFEKAYGFYEKKSAVKDKNGWYHIDINGNEIYSSRYAWVGNYGENRCVVRDFNHNYFHIDDLGERIYTQNYSYTGDFKYGIAVVINNKGKSTHIDNRGTLLHHKYFDELGIFHKGYAIAKDGDGYFHVTKQGDELYEERYEKVEDFYNGYALATTFENSKIVLNESDLTQLQISKPTVDKNKILDESFAYFKYQILFAILKLNVLKDIQENREIELPPISIKLIFRWLYVEKIIDKNKDLTGLGKILENELKPLILYWQDLPFKSSAQMVDTLKNANESFSKIFDKPYFYFLENHNDYAKLSKEMSRYYTVDYFDLIKHLDLSDEIVCDIGGGSGDHIKIIKSAYPNISTIIADKFINNKKDIKIDFFKSFKIQSNVFLLSRVLHDWSDAKALIILENIAKNMNHSSTLYLFETIVQLNVTVDKGVTLSFHLLNFVGGYERTLNDFKILLNSANLEIVNVFEEKKLISLIQVGKK